MIRLYINIRILILSGLLCLTSVSQEWIRTQPNPGEDKVTAAVTDRQGNIYITGYITETVGGINWCTKKINPEGAVVWQKTYNGEAHGEDKAFGIAVDNVDQNVVVTGFFTNLGGNIDIATIKYAALDGNQIGIYRFDDPNNLEDKAFGIAVDRLDNIYITGYITTPGIGKDIYTAKYSSSMNFIWHHTIIGTGVGEDRAFGIAVDSIGRNIYVIGSVTDTGTGIDMVTACYDSTGTKLWESEYPGAGNLEDRAFGIAVDNVGGGNVYVTGFVTDTGSGANYITIKYNHATGDTVWSRRYNGTGNGLDKAFGIAVDNAGSCYVTGMSAGTESDGDYATIRYNTNGVETWAKRINGAANVKDSAASIVYSKGFIYVTGYVIQDTAHKEDVFTVKYDAASGDSLQSSLIDMPPHMTDIGVDVVADTSGHIYIAGYTFNPVTNYDWLELKYNHGQLVIGIQQISRQVPLKYSLYQNYPNPFNPTTKIRFDVLSNLNSNVKLVVYDILGRETGVLVNEQLKAGTYEVDMDASKLASGIYFYKLISGDFTDTKKMILVK